MKRAVMRWISVAFFAGVIGFGFAAVAAMGDSEQVTVPTIIFGVIALGFFITSRVLWSKAKWKCRCGAKGHVIDSEYLGSDVKWSDSSDGKSSTRRVTKKYRLTLQCPSCNDQWYVKTTKAGPTDTFNY